MVFKLVYLMLDALVLNPSAAPIEDDVVLCDDGSPAWGPDGEPNWSCVRNGCKPQAESCWEDRLDQCHREDESDRGMCVRSESTCDSPWSCFVLWLDCDGTYECHESGDVGCTKGTCTTAKWEPEDLVYIP